MDYLVIGALTRDVAPAAAGDAPASGTPAAGWAPGGSVFYAARAIAGWGGRVGIVTTAAPAHPLPPLDPSIAVFRAAGAATATFDNRYAGNDRQQRLCGVPAPLDWAAVPLPWRRARIIHLAPLAGELALPAGRLLPGALIGLTPQGLLRRWDGDGRITPRAWRPSAAQLAALDVIVVSEEDGLDEATLAGWSALGPLTAMTRAERGATLWRAGRRLDVAAAPARVADPTGAGDVWSAALLWQLGAGAALEPAARWACAAAALAIETPGAIPAPAAVADLLRAAYR